MRVYYLRNLPVSEDQTRAYDYVMLSSRYIRLPGTHNGAPPCSIKSYADLGATMERGRSNRHTKKQPAASRDASWIETRSRDVMGKEELAWLCTCEDTDRAEKRMNIKSVLDLIIKLSQKIRKIQIRRFIFKHFYAMDII